MILSTVFAFLLAAAPMPVHAADLPNAPDDAEQTEKAGELIMEGIAAAVVGRAELQDFEAQCFDLSCVNKEDLAGLAEIYEISLESFEEAQGILVELYEKEEKGPARQQMLDEYDEAIGMLDSLMLEIQKDLDRILVAGKGKTSNRNKKPDLMVRL